MLGTIKVSRNNLLQIVIYFGDIIKKNMHAHKYIIDNIKSILPWNH